MRFGSYWIESTMAGTPSLSRRKSICRNCRLWPPPRCRAVILPWLFRPPLRFFGRSRPFTGLAPGVNSAKSLTVAPRRPGVVGLYLRMPMASLSAFSQLSAFSFSRQLSEADS